MNLGEIISTITGNKWLYAAVILVGFFLLARFLIYVFKEVFLKFAKKTKTTLDDNLIKAAMRPLSLILILIGMKLALIPLGFIENFHGFFTHIIQSFIIVVATMLVIRVIDVLIIHWGENWAEKTRAKIDNQLVHIISRFSRVFFALLGLLFILDAWGVKIMPLLASLGIAGIAIAFALQSTLSNIFGGVSLIVDKSVRVGDVIKLDADTKGTVLDVGLRSTKIRTFDNEVIIVPNGKLADSKIQNYAPPDPSVRVVVPFSVAYGSDVEKVKKTVLTIPKKINGFMKDPEPFVIFREMGNSSLDFKLYFWVDSYKKRFRGKDMANTEIYNYLNKAKITIPFPQMDVWIKEHKKKGK